MDPRFEKIYEEGSRLFINKGYSSTQIRDLVKATGISTGALYSLFTGKKAIWNFILKCTISPEFMESDFELPISEDLFSDLEKEVLETFNELGVKLTKPLSSEETKYSFEDLLSEVFDVISSYGVIYLLFEKNQKDSGKLSVTYVDYRKKFYELFLYYINNFIKNGAIRKLEYPTLSARLMIETISWWGMHVRYDAFEVNRDISVQTAKKVCLDALINAYRV